MTSCLCNVEPLIPHFYIVKLGLQGIHYILRVGELYNFMFYILIMNVYILEARGGEINDD